MSVGLVWVGLVCSASRCLIGLPDSQCDGAGRAQHRGRSRSLSGAETQSPWPTVREMGHSLVSGSMTRSDPSFLVLQPWITPSEPGIDAYAIPLPSASTLAARATSAHRVLVPTMPLLLRERRSQVVLLRLHQCLSGRGATAAFVSRSLTGPVAFSVGEVPDN